MNVNGDVSHTQEERLQEILAAYLRDVEAGRNPDQTEILARHPDLAGELQEFFTGQEQFGRLAAPLRQAIESAPNYGITGTLGGFRIVREVGRGGMGIVFEAEQISLRRRVALKVLPFAATMDARHLQRFHNEAQAAACLHHKNIVPVFSVGSERSVHFYAMQFIEGQSLAESIAAQRRGLASGLALAPRETHALGALTRPRSPGAVTQPIATATTQAAPRDAAHYRRIAEWGIQAAEALEHAHCLGIVHRDIKPANLMIDGAGKLWVTDFGLARTTTDGGLTMTGDVLGTLRYMSPEQALAKHCLVDHRTDIYALGATLYELLTLRPAVDGMDREDILRKIAFEEPPLPRTSDRGIPADLETIVLKALAKEPDERYATAQEAADDLRFFLQDRPIHAKRPSFAQRAVKYVRRHKTVAWAVGAGLILALWILFVSSFLLWQEKERVTRALAEKETQTRLAEQQTAAAEKQRLLADANLDIVLNGMTKILERLDEREWPPLVRIEAVHQAVADHLERFFHQRVAGHEHAPANKWDIGWVFQHLGSYHLRRGDHARAERHYRIALAIHEALVDEQPDDRSQVKMYAGSLSGLALVLHVSGRTEEAHGYYLRAREQLRRQLRLQPDRVAYDELAWFLVGCRDPELVDTTEAEQLASRAIELEPNSDPPWRTLGSAQYRNGKWSAAVDSFQNCIRLVNNQTPYDWFFLAMAFWKLGDREQARRSFDQGEKVLKGQRYPFLAVKRFHAEAAALLGISVQPTPKGTNDPPKTAWRKLWADIAEMLAKAQGKAPAEKKPDAK